MGKLIGIVSKISGAKCIIITKDGEFRRVPLPSGPVRVGQEIQASSFEWSALTKYALIAASLLIAVLGVTLYQSSAAATPVAYVSLDINPSLEIAVDKNKQVVDISAFNDDSLPLLNNLDYQGKDVYTVLSMILQRAIELKYVAPDRPNLVVSSVVEVEPKEVSLLDTARLQDAVATPLKGKPLKASVVVYKAKKQDREAAKKASLSTGKYLFYEGERKSGARITLEELKEQSIGTLVETKKAKLPEPQAEIFVQYLNRDPEDISEKPARRHSKNGDKEYYDVEDLDYAQDYARNPREIRIKLKENKDSDNQKIEQRDFRKDKANLINKDSEDYKNKSHFKDENKAKHEKTGKQKDRDKPDDRKDIDTDNPDNRKDIDRDRHKDKNTAKNKDDSKSSDNGDHDDPEKDD